ncbi:hypothetical protein L2U69_09890 [Zavarzinia compransoris]|uniref:hypothetical protein n=1 Tax=Zavarzinia marina TaxID=2911065 RepID=UPI001F283311|nr:hypothetical protein [Zavarzinia marina]MCF4165954.1 hypothetical protein [Zavarzinia marina]
MTFSAIFSRAARAAAALVLALSLGAVPAHAGRRVDEFSSGFWTTYAYQNDDGSFGHCGMETRFDDGLMLAILLATNGVNIVMLNDAWRLKPGGRSSMTVRIDRRYSNALPVGFAGDDAMIAGIGFDPEFWSAFKAGLEMRLELADGRSWNVSLKGSNKATQALTLCYDLYSPEGRKGMFK